MNEAMQTDQRRIKAVLTSFEGCNTESIERLNARGARVLSITQQMARVMEERMMLLDMLSALLDVISDVSQRLEKYEPVSPIADQTLKAAKEAMVQVKKEIHHGA